MQHETSPGGVVAVADLAEFFGDALHCVLADQRVALEPQAEHYVVNMLTLFARAERLYESTPDGLRLKPLAQMFFEALQSDSIGGQTTMPRDSAGDSRSYEIVTRSYSTLRSGFSVPRCTSTALCHRAPTRR